MRRGLDLGIVALLGVALAAIPLFAPGDTYLLGSMEYVLAMVMVAVGLNIVSGYAGQLSLGPGAIFALGGYCAALLADHLPTHVGLAAMCAGAAVVAAVAGLIIGIPALRIGGFYLAMVTLFIALIVPEVAAALQFTGGSTGISLLSNLDFSPSWSGVALYEIGVAMVIAIALLAWLLLHSRLGTRFLVIASSDELAGSLGISPYRTKLHAFLLSALPAGVGGGYYVYSQQFMSPVSANPNVSIYLLAACVIGGLGTVAGPLLGGVLVMSLTRFLGGAQQYDGIIFGVLLAGFALLLPDGLVGLGSGRGRTALSRLLPHRVRPARVADRAYSPTGAPPPPLVAADAGDAVLRLEGVRKQFGGVVAVDDVDLALRNGHLHGLIGSNGSGKTTLINLISGYYRLDGGAVMLGDRRLDRLKPHPIAAAGVARTFQTPKLVEHLTLLDNVVAGGHHAFACTATSSVFRLPSGRRADRAARDLALACLGAVGLADVAGERADEQPHGVRRLAEIARAMALRPRFLLLDEPAAGLSAAELDVLGTLIRRLTDDGMAILLIEHNVPFVMDLASDVTVLHQGRCIAAGTPDEMRGNDDVRLAFLGATV
jgi:ABC-type branched-subunit amino acid transport system ATPase component/ABC-type branched-subunit amino acid transport system permease subunit